MKSGSVNEIDQDVHISCTLLFRLSLVLYFGASGHFVFFHDIRDIEMD